MKQRLYRLHRPCFWHHLPAVASFMKLCQVPTSTSHFLVHVMPRQGARLYAAHVSVDIAAHCAEPWCLPIAVQGQVFVTVMIP